MTRKMIFFVVIATITTVLCDSPDLKGKGTNFTSVSVNFDNISDTEIANNGTVTITPLEHETSFNIEEEERKIEEEDEDEFDYEEEDEKITTEEMITTTTKQDLIFENETETEEPKINLKEVNTKIEKNNDDLLLQENTTLSLSTTVNITATNATVPPPCLNCTTMKTTTDSGRPDDKNPSFLSSFNLNYLYFLLLIIPVVGIFICIYWYCKKRKKPNGYMEPSVQKTKRFSTPSWVFSEPDFQDEEITTLEEEKKQ